MMLEYISPSTRFAQLVSPFTTANNVRLSDVKIAYEVIGKPDQTSNNVILICTGLSTSAHVASNHFDPSKGWWERMVGPEKYIDTNRWCVICVNNLGSCKGSTGPASIDPKNGSLYRGNFPSITIEDIADASVQALRSIGIHKAHCVIGVSMGGMTALSIIERHSHFCSHLVNISSGACSLPYSIAIRNLQREAVEQDPYWNNGHYCLNRYPVNGMMLARKIGLLSYRSKHEINNRFLQLDHYAKTNVIETGYVKSINSYFDYNAERFVCHFDANCYLCLSNAINNYNLAGDDKSVTEVLSELKLDSALIIGVVSDELFPVSQQVQLYNGLMQSGCLTSYVEIDSQYGHDSFLVDIEKFGVEIREFLNRSCMLTSTHIDSTKFLLAEE